MKLSTLSPDSQYGVRQFCKDVLNDEMAAEAISSLPESWAWLWFQMRVAEDREEWFPKGKWAMLQFIESKLCEEAKEAIKPVAK